MTNPSTHRTLDAAVQSWKQSGLTQIQYCKKKNFPFGRLKKYKRDLITKPYPKNKFTRVLKQISCPQSTSLKLTFPQGTGLDFSILNLKDVLQAIQGTSL